MRPRLLWLLEWIGFVPPTPAQLDAVDLHMEAVLVADEKAARWEEYKRMEGIV